MGSFSSYRMCFSARAMSLRLSRTGAAMYEEKSGARTDDHWKPGTPGVVDSADVVAHAYTASRREQAVGETDYRDAPIEVRRWR